MKSKILLFTKIPTVLLCSRAHNTRLRGAMYDQKVLPDMTGTRPDSTISLVRFDPVKEMDILRVRVGTPYRDRRIYP